MTLRIPTHWLIAAAASAATCATFAVTFYPRGPSEEEKYAVAAQRKKAYDTIGKGHEALFAEKKDEALAAYREALTIDPGVSSAYYLIGTIELNDGNLEEAISEFDQALKFDKYPEHIYNNRGAARLRQGDLKGALSDFNAALDLKPGFRQPQINRGLIRLQQDDPAAARKDFDTVITGYQQPSDGIEAYVGRGIARAKLADLAGAEADLTLAREWAEGKQQMLGTLFNRAVVREMKGDAAGAQADRAEYTRLKDLPKESIEFVRPLKGADEPTKGKG